MNPEPAAAMPHAAPRPAPRFERTGRDHDAPADTGRADHPRPPAPQDRLPPQKPTGAMVYRIIKGA